MVSGHHPHRRPIGQRRRGSQQTVAAGVKVLQLPRNGCDPTDDRPRLGLPRRKFTGRSSLGCAELAIDEVVECEVQLSPGTGEWAALGDVVRHQGVQECEAGGEDAAMGLGEQHGSAPAERGELVAL